MTDTLHRRRFLQAAAALAMSFIPGISIAHPPSLDLRKKKRLVIMFSPNGMVKKGFWPQREGSDFEMTPVLKPLEDLRSQTLVVHGICNKIRGDGDSHMRGMSCLLTANELFPGNIQGGGSSPAGWAKGISIDQEIKNFLQSQTETRTRFGSLEFGVRVPNQANPWTRMVYAGPNQPIAPISNPYQMFDKMYGQIAGRENLSSVLGMVDQRFENARARPQLGSGILQSHQKFIVQMEREIQSATEDDLPVEPIQLPQNVADAGHNMPELAKMQIDLLVNGFVNDLTRIATLQFSRSVGNEKMSWLDVKQGHHTLSHNPDKDAESQEQLTRINSWYCQQLAYLAMKLKNTPEPGFAGESMLDNTLILWTNELGHGSSHSLNNLPMVMVGGGFGFQMGQYVKVKSVSTDRLWLAIAHAMGHEIQSFGIPNIASGRLDLNAVGTG